MNGMHTQYIIYLHFYRAQVCDETRVPSHILSFLSDKKIGGRELSRMQHLFHGHYPKCTGSVYIAFLCYHKHKTTGRGECKQPFIQFSSDGTGEKERLSLHNNTFPKYLSPSVPYTLQPKSYVFSLA